MGPIECIDYKKMESNLILYNTKVHRFLKIQIFVILLNGSNSQFQSNIRFFTQFLINLRKCQKFFFFFFRSLFLVHFSLQKCLLISEIGFFANKYSCTFVTSVFWFGFCLMILWNKYVLKARYLENPSCLIDVKF